MTRHTEKPHEPRAASIEAVRSASPLFIDRSTRSDSMQAQPQVLPYGAVGRQSNGDPQRLAASFNVACTKVQMAKSRPVGLVAKDALVRGNSGQFLQSRIRPRNLSQCGSPVEHGHW